MKRRRTTPGWIWFLYGSEDQFGQAMTAAVWLTAGCLGMILFGLILVTALVAINVPADQWVMNQKTKNTHSQVRTAPPARPASR